MQHFNMANQLKWINFSIIIILIVDNVSSGCDIKRGPGGYSDCVYSPLYREYQWATCLPNTLIQTQQHQRCTDPSALYCWHQCMAISRESRYGDIPAECVCDPDKNKQAVKLTIPERCYVPTGKCLWYSECLNKCEYLEQQHCESFDEEYKDFSEKGKQWIVAMKNCVQVKLVPFLYPQVENRCSKIRETENDVIKDCYKKPSKYAPAFCELTLMDKWRVAWIHKNLNILKHTWKCFISSYPYNGIKDVRLTFHVKNPPNKLTTEKLGEYAEKIIQAVSVKLNWSSRNIEWILSVSDKAILAQKIAIIPVYVQLAPKSYDGLAENVENAIQHMKDKKEDVKSLMITDGSVADLVQVDGCNDPLCISHSFSYSMTECKNLPILSRDIWEAKRPTSKSGLRLPVSMFFIHHTDTSSCHDITTCSRKIRSIQKYHMQTKKWNDIAYSFLIGGDGYVYEGRGWKTIGSHTYNYNSRSLAICFIGNFNTQMPTQAALSAAHKLLECGIQNSYLVPEYSLYGHRDVKDTVCPGDVLYDAIRKWDHYNITTDLDGPCLKKGGHCSPNNLPCTGHYTSGLCNGYSKRQCCIPLQVTLPQNMANYTCHGDVMLLRPSGKKTGGVTASQNAVSAHMTLANRFHKCFNQVGADLCIHPAVIAGVASRESNFGFSLTQDGWGDNHNAYGMMQCDIRFNAVRDECPELNCTSYEHDSCEHIDMMTQCVLIPYITKVESKFPKWQPHQQLQGGIAAYNFGIKNVQSWDRLDIGSTGDDYSNDIIARAQHLITEFKW